MTERFAGSHCRGHRCRNIRAGRAAADLCFDAAFGEIGSAAWLGSDVRRDPDARRMSSDDGCNTGTARPTGRERCSRHVARIAGDRPMPGRPKRCGSSILTDWRAAAEAEAPGTYTMRSNAAKRSFAVTVKPSRGWHVGAENELR